MDHLSKSVIIHLFHTQAKYLKKIFLVLAFERLKVFEPETKLTKGQIYADVLIKIKDEVLIGKYLQALLIIQSQC